MKLSVNILTWNCVNTLKETLDILTRDLKDIEHEIIVIDNGSSDGSADLATIKNPENRGVSVGKNQGIDISRGEYIMLLDGDIVPVENSVNLLIDFLDNNYDKMAIGFYPNKFTDQKNKNGQRHHEEFCHVLWNPTIHSQVIAFYGMFHKNIFKEMGIRFPEDGPFSGVGYGWEDSDVYMQMRELGVHQWVAGMNHPTGRYYHEINSSIRLMGDKTYIDSSKARREAFKKKWGEKEKLYYA